MTHPICWIVGHRWTSIGIQNGYTVPEELKPGPEDTPRTMRVKFAAFSRMWCARCGKSSSQCWPTPEKDPSAVIRGGVK